MYYRKTSKFNRISLTIAIIMIALLKSTFAAELKNHDIPKKGEKFYANVDKLRIRNKPGLKWKAFDYLSEGEEVIFLGEISAEKVKLTLRGKNYNTPFYKVKTKKGKIGWVYAGALRLKVTKSTEPNTNKIIFVGPKRKYKSLNDIFVGFDDAKHNCYIKIDPGIYKQNDELWINGNNLVIEGMGKVELRCHNMNANVIWISGKNITIRNLRLRHFKTGNPEEYNCTGRVIALEDAHNVLIENCDINGCGLVGVHDNMGNSKVTLRNNYIHNNSVAPFGNMTETWMTEIKNHPVFIFENNRVENNGPGRVFEK